MLILTQNQINDWFYDADAPATVCYARGPAWSLAESRDENPEVKGACDTIDRLMGWRERPRQKPRIVAMQRRIEGDSFEYLLQKVRYPERSRSWAD